MRLSVFFLRELYCRKSIETMYLQAITVIYANVT